MLHGNRDIRCNFLCEIKSSFVHLHKYKENYYRNSYCRLDLTLCYVSFFTLEECVLCEISQLLQQSFRDSKFLLHYIEEIYI